jgi:hypothetical protein
MKRVKAAGLAIALGAFLIAAPVAPKFGYFIEPHDVKPAKVGGHGVEPAKVGQNGLSQHFSHIMKAGLYTVAAF